MVDPGGGGGEGRKGDDEYMYVGLRGELMSIGVLIINFYDVWWDVKWNMDRVLELGWGTEGGKKQGRRGVIDEGWGGERGMDEGWGGEGGMNEGWGGERGMD